MEVYATEEEQLERVRRFFRDNRIALIGGAVLAVGSYWGWTAWQSHQRAQAENASMEYLGMAENLMQGQVDSAEKHAGRVVGQYADTPYAALASLALARIKMEKGDAAAAHAHLKWAVDNAKDPMIKQVANLRLARLLYSQSKFSEALTQLNGDAAAVFASDAQELRGDIYLAQKKPEEARKAYAEALAKFKDKGSARKALLQMKLDDLGGPTQAPAKAE